MSQKIITEAKPIEYNGAPAAKADRGPPVEVVVSGETGKAEVVVQGGSPQTTRQAVIAAAKAKRAARGGTPAASEDDGMVGSGPAGDEPVRTQANAAAESRNDPANGEPHPDAAPEPDDGDVGSGPEGDVAPQAADVAATAEPAAEPSGEPDSTADDPRAELARARARLDEIDRGRAVAREQALDTFIEDPVTAFRGWVAEQLSIDPQTEEGQKAIDDSMRHLSEELTWGSIPAQDLPQDKQAQLQMARWSREKQLQTHRRKADQGKRTRDDLEKRARTQAERSYEALRQKHPNLALVAEDDGRDVSDVINATLVEAMRVGLIRKDAPIEAAYQEAIRLADAHATTRAKQKAARFAHLAPATAPTKPGASSPTKAPDKQTSSPAAPRAPSPRALPAAKAGAAPSRPAEPASQQPKRIVIDASNREDPSDRRREVLSRHRRT